MDDKIMKVLRCESLRELVEFSLKYKVKKEDIVALLDKQNYYLLVYYGEQ